MLVISNYVENIVHILSKKKKSSIPYSSTIVSIRPDISHVVSVVSRYLSYPGKSHWEAAKWILTYLRGIAKLCLCFGDSKPILKGSSNVNMVGDLDERRSTYLHLQRELHHGIISCKSVLSTIEAEIYITIIEAGQEMLLMIKFVSELGLNQLELILSFVTVIECHRFKQELDVPFSHKHIDVRYHWLRSKIEDQLVQLNKIHTYENVVDLVTKAVSKEKLELCVKLVGLITN